MNDAGRPDQAKRRRLLLLTNSVAMGGMEEHVRLLARDIDRSLFDVVAMAPAWEPTERFAVQLSGVADRFYFATPDRRHGVRNLVAETFRLWRRARQECFDVAHIHGTSYHGLTFAVLALRAAGVRRLLVTEHLAPESEVGWLQRHQRALLMKLVSVVVCVSENNRQARLRYLGGPSGKTAVVNNGIDVNDFVPLPGEDLATLRSDLGIDDDAPVVGTAIRFEPSKGVADLVQAFAHVERVHPRAVLLLVGDGSIRGALESQVEELELATAVRFVGFQSDPRPYVSLMDAFVLPVPCGSASIALLEAMAMSRPCVITFGGDREAVQHGVSGFCAQPNDPASIARCVNDLLDDPELRSRFGTNARERVESDYSSHRVARELETLYARL
jgi:glycosyltransferase involved in cell wall biosynthesis